MAPFTSLFHTPEHFLQVKSPWTQSNLKYDRVQLALSSDGTKGIAGSYQGIGIYYTNDSGETWTQSNKKNGSFENVALSSDGKKGIAGSTTGIGIYYTDNFGANWMQSNIKSDESYYSLKLSSDGTKGIVGSYFGIYYTNNSGATWTQSNITSGFIYSIALSSDGKKSIAGSEYGIYYTKDSGVTWTISNITEGYLGIKGIAGSVNGNGIYFTSNSGVTWTQSNIKKGDFNLVYISANGTTSIASNYSGKGIYYSITNNIQEKIEKQIKNILSKKGISDYSIKFCDGNRKLILKVKGSCNKCICISYENFTNNQILADNPKWLKCLNCKTGCSKKM